MKMRKNLEYSIKRRMLYILISSLVPVIVVLIFYNLYAINVFINQKMAESSSNTLSLYRIQLDDTLNNIDKQMIDILANNAEFKALAYTEGGGLNAHLNAYELMDKYISMINLESRIAAFLILNKSNDVFRATYQNNIHGVKLKDEILAYFIEYSLDEEREKVNKWMPIVINDKPFLYRIMGYRDTYSVCLINLNTDKTDEKESYMDSGAEIVFITEEGILTGESVIKDNHVSFSGSDKYYFSGSPQKYLIVEESLDNAKVKLAYLNPYYGIWKNLNNSQFVLFICSLLTLLIIPAGYYFMRKMFFTPVNMLVKTMESIKSGNMELKMDESFRALEFRQVNETFNSMLNQIKQLKIDSYEKELGMQKVMLQYYQIQIKPHFYINCLKSIYGMAEDEKYEKIQKMILYLSKHFRYMMQEGMIVLIRDELQFIRNYILLQEISMQYPPNCIIEVDVSILDMKIPAISILSFVENSVKYSAGMENNLEIKIKTTMLQSEDGVIANITISDNGIGFPEDVLQKLNYFDQNSSCEGHIGIYNVIQRFILYYGKENVGFAFSNSDGARIEIFIKQVSKSEGEGHEAVDS